MATYFVGQRVRIVLIWSHPELLGREGRITGPFEECWSPFYGIWHGWPLDIRTSNGDQVVAEEEALEPILPSGHTAGTESFQELMDRLNTQRVEKVEEVGA